MEKKKYLQLPPIEYGEDSNTGNIFIWMIMLKKLPGPSWIF